MKLSHKENLMAAQSTANVSTPRPHPAREFHEEFHVGRDILEYVKDYAREKPEVAALWCFGIGFILGWKLKPW
jgi:hypothetical protein